MSEKLIEGGYDDHGDDLDDWDPQGESPDKPGLYLYEVWFSADESGDFWLTKPTILYDLTGDLL